MPLQKIQSTRLSGRTPQHRDAREKGQAILEMAFALPILLILVLGIFDFGMALRSYVTITNATREGARLSIVACESSTDVTTVKARVVAYSSGLLSATNVSVDADDATTGNQDCSSTLPSGGHGVTVSATYTYNMITPLGNLVTALAGPITLSSSTTMRAEN
jgi:Flp pilus assembly protein TadG